jgi:hypothetical protein
MPIRNIALTLLLHDGRIAGFSVRETGRNSWHEVAIFSINAASRRLLVVESDLLLSRMDFGLIYYRPNIV